MSVSHKQGWISLHQTPPRHRNVTATVSDGTDHEGENLSF